MTVVFRIHYFLWYGALTSIFGYEGVYARYYTNATTMQFGYLKMILPFATVLVTPFVCSLADRRQSHRAIFVSAILVAMMAISCLALLPLVLTPNDQNHTGTSGLFDRNSSVSSEMEERDGGKNRLLVGPWIFYCLATLAYDLSIGVTTCLSDSFAVLQAEATGTNFGRIIVWGTIGWASSGLVLSLINQATFLPRLMPGIMLGTVLLTIDVIVMSLWRRNKDFLLDVIPKEAAHTITGSSSSAHVDPSDYLPHNESALVNMGSELDEKTGITKRNTRNASRLLPGPNFGYKHKRLSAESRVSSKSAGTVSVKTIDSEILTEVLSASSDKSFSPTVNQEPEKDEEVAKKSLVATKLIPCLNISEKKEMTGISPNMASAEQQKRKVEIARKTTSFRVQCLLLSMIICKRKSLIRHLILFILSGFFMAMHWNYFFLYLERIYFERFELISALSMVGQSILGELPFFILSRKFIDNLGRSHTLSFSVITIGIRFLLYCYLLPNATMYLIFVADCLQGPNYGLFYVVMTEVGLEYSFCDDDTIDKMVARGEVDCNDKSQVDSLRLSLRSTLQSVAFACYEGIGVGLGSLTGGWLVHKFGFTTLWLSMAIAAISVGVANIVIELFCRETEPRDGDRSARKEFVGARRDGLLRRLTSPRPLPISTTPPLRPMTGVKTLPDKRAEPIHGPVAFTQPIETTAMATDEKIAVSNTGAGTDGVKAKVIVVPQAPMVEPTAEELGPDSTVPASADATLVKFSG